MADTQNILSVCSGVGMLDEGLAFGLRYFGFTPRVLGYCERDAYAAACLLARMEESSLEPAPVWCGNIEDMDRCGLRGRADWLTAGFPCPPVSTAGKRLGIEDERWIWPAIADLIREVEPRGVFLENVRGLLSAGDGAATAAVLGDLARLGFDAEWTVLSARAVGASHKRERVFILAHSIRVSGGERARREGGKRGRLQRSADAGGTLGNASGERRQAGNVALQRSGDQPTAGQADDAIEGCSQLAIAGQPGLPQPEQTELSGTGRGNEGGATAELRGTPNSIFAPGPSDPAWPDILRECPHLAPAVKPGVCVLADGVALVLDESRADQLRCGGNGVVALQAAAAFVGLMRRLMSDSTWDGFREVWDKRMLIAELGAHDREMYQRMNEEQSDGPDTQSPG